MELEKLTLDLSCKQLKKVPKREDAQNVRILKLDENELQKIDNIDSYLNIETLTLSKNQLLRMYGVCRLHNLRELNLSYNGILSIEGIKDCIHLRHLNLEGNNIKTIEHLNNNINLEYLNLAENSIGCIADISFLKNLKELYLHGNRLTHLRQCDKYLPTSLKVLTLTRNYINDLNEISTLSNLCNLYSITISENPCVTMPAGADGFDYRPFVLNWCMSVKVIDGFSVDPIESLKAEWLYSQGRGRQFRLGEQAALAKYLSNVCPLIGKALENENEKKLRLILSKAQQHQRQLQEEILEHSHTSGSNSPSSGRKKPTSRIQSPRFSRLSGRQCSPEAMVSSYHGNTTSEQVANANHMVQMTTSLIENIKNDSMMSQSFDSSNLSGNSITSTNNSITSNKANNAQETTPRTNTPNSYNEQALINTAGPLAAASKMVPVPETLMSPDVCPTLVAQRVTVTAINSQIQNSKIIKNKDNKLNSPKMRSPQLKRNNTPQEQQQSNSPTMSPRKMNTTAATATHHHHHQASVIQQHNAANLHKASKAKAGQTNLHGSIGLNNASNTNNTNSSNISSNNQNNQMKGRGVLTSSSMHVSTIDTSTCDVGDGVGVGGALSSDDDSDHINVDKLKTIRNKAAQRYQQNQDNLDISNMNYDDAMDTESSAVVIQKIWRGYHTRKRTKDIAEKLLKKRTQEYIEKLTKDMEMTKAQLENERKIQQLQMQAISALWKKVSTMQGAGSITNTSNTSSHDAHENITDVGGATTAVPGTDAASSITDEESKKSLSLDNNSTAVVNDLAKTCSMLTNQVEQLQGSMRDILRCLTLFCNLPHENIKKIIATGMVDALAEDKRDSDTAGTQTEIIAVHTPQIENQTNFPFTKIRPSTLPLETTQQQQRVGKSGNTKTTMKEKCTMQTQTLQQERITEQYEQEEREQQEEEEKELERQKAEQEQQQLLRAQEHQANVIITDNETLETITTVHKLDDDDDDHHHHHSEDDLSTVHESESTEKTDEQKIDKNLD